MSRSVASIALGAIMEDVPFTTDLGNHMHVPVRLDLWVDLMTKKASFSESKKSIK